MTRVPVTVELVAVSVVQVSNRNGVEVKLVFALLRGFINSLRQIYGQ
jgi:hypothetical protein